MKKHALWLPVLLALAGCSTTPGWDGQFGDSVRQARASQVLDPRAALRPAGPESLDGKAAAGAMRGYANSYGYAVQESRPSTVLQLVPGTGQ